MYTLNAPGQHTRRRAGNIRFHHGNLAVLIGGIACAGCGCSSDGTTTVATKPVNNPVWAESPAAPWPEKVNGVDDLKNKSPELKTAKVSDKGEPVPEATAIGPGSWTEGQKRFASLVAAAGIRRQVVTVEGQEYPLQPGQTEEIPKQGPTIGYKLEKDQFATYSYKAVNVAKSVVETLNAVNDAEVYPGRVFLANPYFQNGDVQEPNVSPAIWAPVKIAMYGPPLNTGDPKRLSELPTSYGSPDSKDGRRHQYETARAQILPLVTEVGNWENLTETTYSKEHLELQASLKVSGKFGFVSGEVKSGGTQESSTVFMKLFQEAYRITVDNAETAPGWVVPSPSAEELAKFGEVKNPLLYFSEVIYGRVILVAATSQLSEEELKAAIKGDVTAYQVKYSGEARKDFDSKLGATTFHIISFGGEGMPGKHCKFEEYPQELSRLKEAKLKPQTALPIAYKARWLADKSPAAWVGVTPLRYATVKRDPITYSVFLKNYTVKDTHNWERVIDRRKWNGEREWHNEMVAGSLAVAAHDGREKYETNKFQICPVTSGQDQTHSPNCPLLDEVAIPKLKFSIGVRQGGGGSKNWDDLKINDNFDQKFIEVDVQKLIDTTTREMTEKVQFGDGNTAEVLIRINAPVVKKLGDLPTAPKAGVANK
jgi:hypothetical protein